MTEPTDHPYWSPATIAGHRLRLWADPRAGRVLIQLDDPEPADLAVIEGLNADEARATLNLKAERGDWAPAAVEDLWRAALTAYNDAERQTGVR